MFNYDMMMTICAILLFVAAFIFIAVYCKHLAKENQATIEDTILEYKNYDENSQNDVNRNAYDAMNGDINGDINTDTNGYSNGYDYSYNYKKQDENSDKKYGYNNSDSKSKFPFKTYIINLDRKPERYKYVSSHIEKIGIHNHVRWPAIDGFYTSPDFFKNIGFSDELSNRQGIAGCAASHVTLWKHLAEQDSDWTLILEDDAHFHPKFMDLFYEYWNSVPGDAKIIFLGHCGTDITDDTTLVIKDAVMCLHAYIINGEGAKYLLHNLKHMHEPIDIEIIKHFKSVGTGSYIFNGNVTVRGICPNDYKIANDNKCEFDGVVYQNKQEYGSTIHKIETVME